MTSMLTGFYRRHPIFAAFLSAGAALCLVIAVSQAIAWAGWARFAWHARALAAKQPAGTSRVYSVLFVYRGRTYFLQVPVGEGERIAAEKLSTERVFAERGAVRAAYLRSLVSASARGQTVAGMCTQLRAIRDRLGLDADSYAELLARVAQQVPYGPVAARFGAPAQLVAEGDGVCSGKSVLLAALLVHEGYDAAIVALDANDHAAVGIRGTARGYLGSGYAYIETTRDSYVGQVPPQCAGTGAVGWRTQIVPVGGSRAYGRAVESAYLGEMLNGARADVRTLGPYLELASRQTSPDQACYAGLVSQAAAATSLSQQLELSIDDPATEYARVTGAGGR